jgi:XRE family transcriptional regulator, regulator of sulfur utilization
MISHDRQPPQDLQNSQILFGKNIRAVRDSMNISREIAAERAGIDADYLGEIERGEKWPALWMIRAIARALEVSPARFFEFEDEADATTDVVEKFQRILDSRTPEQQSQALRIIRALFGL